jgi:hypothetical protein
VPRDERSGRASIAGRVAVALVLGATGLMKLFWPDDAPVGDGSAAADVIGVVSRLSPAIGALEIALAVGLIWASQKWQQRAALCACLMLAVGVCLLLWLRYLGGPATRCGCFGRVIQLDLGRHLLLNGALLALLAPIAAPRLRVEVPPDASGGQSA